MRCILMIRSWKLGDNRKVIHAWFLINLLKIDGHLNCWIVMNLEFLNCDDSWIVEWWLLNTCGWVLPKLKFQCENLDGNGEGYVNGEKVEIKLRG